MANDEQRNTYPETFGATTFKKHDFKIISFIAFNDLIGAVVTYGIINLTNKFFFGNTAHWYWQAIADTCIVLIALILLLPAFGSNAGKRNWQVLILHWRNRKPHYFRSIDVSFLRPSINIIGNKYSGGKKKINTVDSKEIDRIVEKNVKAKIPFYSTEVNKHRNNEIEGDLNE